MKLTHLNVSKHIPLRSSLRYCCEREEPKLKNNTSALFHRRFLVTYVNKSQAAEHSAPLGENESLQMKHNERKRDRILSLYLFIKKFISLFSIC